MMHPPLKPGDIIKVSSVTPWGREVDTVTALPSNDSMVDSFQIKAGSIVMVLDPKAKFGPTGAPLFKILHKDKIVYISPNSWLRWDLVSS